MKKQRESLDNIIDDFKEYKVPKYLENDFLVKALKCLPMIRIKGVFHRFNVKKELVPVKEVYDVKHYYTSAKKSFDQEFFITSIIYENSTYIVERYIGMILEFNSETYCYKVGLIACNIFSKKSNRFYYFSKGIYTTMAGRTIFFLDDQKIRKKSRHLYEYYYLDACSVYSKYRFKNVSNKYIKRLYWLDVYDLAMIWKNPKLETFYKTYCFPDVKHRIVFIEYFLKKNVELNYKVFCDVCYKNISEYLVKIEYLGASFKNVDIYTYAYWADLLERGFDKKYLYMHYKELSYFSDYVKMRAKGFADYPEYPKYIKKLHDELMLKVKISENEELIEKLNNVIAKNKRMFFEYYDYKYYVPTFSDMINYSNELNLCIKSAGYIERMANGKCLLVFCEKKDNPSKLEKFAAELVKNDNGYKINQFHGFNNDAGGSSAFMQLRAKLLDALRIKLGC